MLRVQYGLGFWAWVSGGYAFWGSGFQVQGLGVPLERLVYAYNMRDVQGCMGRT